jgi:hypothetical protein
MGNKKVYLHEYIDIILNQRGNYFEHMTTGWSHAQAERRQRTFGIWGTVGSTGRWPEVINMWEFDSIHDFAADLRFETGGSNMQDPTMHEWWNRAQTMRSGGYDRILYPTDYSLDLAGIWHRKLIGHELHYHQRIALNPGQADLYLEMLGEDWKQTAEAQYGIYLIGAYKTALRNDSEAILLWSIPTWTQWADMEEGWRSSSEARAWVHRTRGLAVDWINTCMCNAPQSPMRTGRAP